LADLSLVGMVIFYLNKLRKLPFKF